MNQFSSPSFSRRLGCRRERPELGIPLGAPESHGDVDEEAAVCDNDDPLDSDSHEGGVHSGAVNGPTIDGDTSDAGPVEGNPPSVEDNTTLLEACLLHALKTSVPNSSLPMLVSTFMAQHVLPARPTGMQIDVKRTKYKKTSVFLNAMAEKGLIAVAETAKGVLSLTAVHRSHPDLLAFQPFENTVGESATARADSDEQPANRIAVYALHEVQSLLMLRTPQEAAIAALRAAADTNSSASAATAADGDTHVLPAPEVVELEDGRPAHVWTVASIRKLLTIYVRTFRLQAANARMVRLDENLVAALGAKQTELNQSVSREDLATRCVAALHGADTLSLTQHGPIDSSTKCSPAIDSSFETTLGHRL
jgi:hypothetical protein